MHQTLTPITAARRACDSGLVSDRVRVVKIEQKEEQRNKGTGKRRSGIQEREKEGEGKERRTGRFTNQTPESALGLDFRKGRGRGASPRKRKAKTKGI
jgi:hypothetical protein